MKLHIQRKIHKVPQEGEDSELEFGIAKSINVSLLAPWGEGRESPKIS